MRPHIIVRLIVLGLCAVVTVAARAQDPVFSQYTASAPYNNPGMVGLFEGEVRLSANYRDQWGSVLGASPLRTFAGAAEMRYAVGRKDFIGVGVNALRDEGGDARMTFTGGGLAVAMQKHLGGGRGRDATYLGFGSRVGYGQQEVNPDALWYSGDLDTSTLIITRGSGAGGQGALGKAYLDVSAGVHFSVVRRGYSCLVGVGGHHLNWPNPSLLYNPNLLLPARYTVFAAAEYLVRPHLRILPSTSVDVQAQSRRVQTGAAVLYRSGQEGDAGFRFGTYGRLSSRYEGAFAMEAVVLVAQVEFARTTIGMSYDVNTGSVGRAVNARGAYELSMSWTREGRSRYRVVCPKL